MDSIKNQGQQSVLATDRELLIRFIRAVHVFRSKHEDISVSEN